MKTYVVGSYADLSHKVLPIGVGFSVTEAMRIIRQHLTDEYDTDEVTIDGHGTLWYDGEPFLWTIDTTQMSQVNPAWVGKNRYCIYVFYNPKKVKVPKKLPIPKEWPRRSTAQTRAAIRRLNEEATLRLQVNA